MTSEPFSEHKGLAEDGALDDQEVIASAQGERDAWADIEARWQQSPTPSPPIIDEED